MPPAIGKVEVLWASADPGATEVRLKRWAIDELTNQVDGIVYPDGQPPPPERDAPVAFEWRNVFEPGDIVRRRDGATIGVVLGVVNYSSDDSPRYELHVDAAVDGRPDGVGCWDPWIAVISNDAEAVAEARRLGLRGLVDRT